MLGIRFARAAQKALARLPEKHKRQVAAKIQDLRTNPLPHDSGQMKGKSHEYRRVDVGEYRVIYRVEGEEILIAAAGRRNDDAIYKEFVRSKKR
jgi:mRNA interferase RelE/StbE